MYIILTCYDYKQINPDEYLSIVVHFYFPNEACNHAWGVVREARQQGCSSWPQWLNGRVAMNQRGAGWWRSVISWVMREHTVDSVVSVHLQVLIVIAIEIAIKDWVCIYFGKGRWIVWVINSLMAPYLKRRYYTHLLWLLENQPRLVCGMDIDHARVTDSWIALGLQVMVVNRAQDGAVGMLRWSRWWFWYNFCTFDDVLWYIIYCNGNGIIIA